MIEEKNKCIPVCPRSLRSEIHAIRSDIFLIHDLTEAEVCDLDFSAHRPTAQ